MEDAEAAALRATLAGSGLDAERQRLLFDLGCFHRREAKPAWWAIFDSLGRDTDELIDDLDCLGGLEAAGPARVRGALDRPRLPLSRAGDPAEAGSQPTTPLAEPYLSVTLAALDRERPDRHREGRHAARASPCPTGCRCIRRRRSTRASSPPGCAAAIADQCGPRRHRALDDLLARRAPRLDGGPAADILGGADPVAGTVRAVLAMQDTVLPIQGPPGTGKTYVAARAILALVAAGRRVAVASTSHEAIRTCCAAASPRCPTTRPG